jgi:uncharacterized protein YraI
MATRIFHSVRWTTGVAAVVALLLLAGCGGLGAEATPMPTRTPLPTFTPTPPDGQVAEPVAEPIAEPVVDPNAAVQPPPAPVQGEQGQPPAPATEAAQPDQPPAAAPTEAPTAAPSPTPAPAAAEVVTNDIINVRRGPGTNYDLLGSAQTGTKFKATGKSPAGDWWQIDYNGQPGWVFGQLVTASGTEAIAVAQNIPAAPTAAPAPPPTNTPQPQQEAQPQPTAAPSKKYFFNVQVVSKCERQPAGNWFEGKTYVGGQPKSGYKVVFSVGPDGGWITEPQTTGPHEGYPGWDPGYYSHIIRANGPIVGTWYVWVVDDAGQRISEIANFTTTGPGEGCNQAVVDFDSR